MIQKIMGVIINLVISLIQIVLAPLNLIVTNLFPNLSDTILTTTNYISGAFNGMGWAIGIIPTSVLLTLIAILELEIAKHSLYVTSHLLVKAWNVLQKIKFW